MSGQYASAAEAVSAPRIPEAGRSGAHRRPPPPPLHRSATIRGEASGDDEAAKGGGGQQREVCQRQKGSWQQNNVKTRCCHGDQKCTADDGAGDCHVAPERRAGGAGNRKVSTTSLTTKQSTGKHIGCTAEVKVAKPRAPKMPKISRQLPTAACDTRATSATGCDAAASESTASQDPFDMREILTVQVGGAGIRLGNQFWDYIRTEHGVDHLGVYHGNSHLQLQYIDVYFSDIEMKRHVPRAILVDSGNVTDSTKYNRWQLPMLITLPHVSGSAGTGNVFSHGLLHRSRSSMPSAAALARASSAHFCANCATTTPGWYDLDGAAQPGGLGQGGRALQCSAERARSDRQRRRWSAQSTTRRSRASAPASCAPLTRNYDVMNSVAPLAMSGTTACVRFPGQQNSDWRGVTANLVPFPRLHFLTLQPGSAAPRNFAEQSPQPRPAGSHAGPLPGLRCLFPRPAQHGAGGRGSRQGQRPHRQQRPGAGRLGRCGQPHRRGPRAGRSVDKFRKMFKKRAFMHWYEGLTEADFAEAEKRTVDLVAEYIQLERQPKQAGGVDEQCVIWAGPVGC
uniref:Tubulin domain-containing protein n=1 Tax=Macrostomum lignano TaxID=282301 RepID=A0A1I8JPW5_9PLAT